jgi:hypothetical protein
MDANVIETNIIREIRCERQATSGELIPIRITNLDHEFSRLSCLSAIETRAIGLGSIRGWEMTKEG